MKSAAAFLLGLLAAGPWPVAANDAPGEPVFRVSRYEVSGNTLLDPADLEAVLLPHSGPNRRFADIEAARQALRAAYAAQGFGTVEVSLPEQEISDGQVHLHVREIRVGQVELRGAAHHDAANIRASLPGLSEGGVPNTVRVAESLRLANENPAKQTQMLFKAGKQAGEVDALIRVEDSAPRKTFLTLDNSGNDQTGQARLGLGWQDANLFNRDHVLTLQYLTSPTQPDDVSIFGLGYRIPLYRSADVIDLHAGYSNVDSGTVSDVFQVSGKGLLLGARYSLNFTKRSAFEHRLIFALDYRAFTNSVDFLGTPLGTDVTVHPIGLTYAGSWERQGTQLAYQAGVSHNVPGGAHGGDADFAAARAGADARYSVFRLGASLRRALPGDWHFGASLDGQITAEPLVSGEQFGLGGKASVRGFAERVVSGDQGWRAGIELTGPDLGTRVGTSVGSVRLSTFLEGGEVRRHNLQPGDAGRDGIASVGVGLSFALERRFNARLDYGHVLDGGGETHAGDGRLHANLAWLF